MFDIGDKIYIEDAGRGAKGCNEYTGVVVKGKKANDGLLDKDKGICVEIIKNKIGGNVDRIGELWKISLNGRYILLKE